MTTITIDATELHEAAPRIGALYATLAMSARQLRAVDVSCEMPPGLAGQISSGVSSAASDLAGAERTMNGMDKDIRERALLAKIADAIGRVSFGTVTLKLPADLIDAARQADEAGRQFPYGVSARAGGVAHAIKGVLGAVGTLGDLYDVANTYVNPYIDDNRKGAELATKGATVGGVLLAGGIGAGLAGVAVVSLPGVAIAVGVAVGFSVLDKHFHISDKVSDGVNSALDAAGEGLDDAGEALEDVGEGINDAADKAKDFVGGLF